jgi:hypothetical protein
MDQQHQQQSAFPLMIRASALVEKLRSTLGDGVDSALLLSGSPASAGALLAAVSATRPADFARSQECHMLVALVANIWRSYSSTLHGMPADPTMMMMMFTPQQAAGLAASGSGFGGAGGGGTTELEAMVLDLDTGRICCAALGGRHVLVLHSSSPALAEIGMMKVKAANATPDLLEALRLVPPTAALRNIGGDASSAFMSPTKS